MLSVPEMQQRSKHMKITAFLVLSLHVDRDGWSGSLAHIIGARCHLLKGKGDKELVEGHMVSSGQSWDKASHTPASGSGGLCQRP